MRAETVLVSALLSTQLLASHAATMDSRPLGSKENTSPNSQQSSPSIPMQAKVSFGTPQRKDLFGNRFETDYKALGYGEHGAVYTATEKMTNKRVAVKVIPVNDSNRDQVDEEACVLSRFAGQPHILHLHAVYGDKMGIEIMLVTELIEGCSLDRFCRLFHGEEIDPTFTPAIARQLVQALAYIHNEGFIHNDVKPGNVMLSKRGGVKLIDFGFCRRYDPQNRHAQGTPLYVSPEKFTKVISPAADVWALGVTIFSLHSDPYSTGALTLGIQELGRKIIKYGCPWPAQAGEEDPWDRFSDEAREFCEQCLRMNHHDRAKMAELADTDFIKNSCSDVALDAYIQTL